MFLLRHKLSSEHPWISMLYQLHKLLPVLSEKTHRSASSLSSAMRLASDNLAVLLGTSCHIMTLFFIVNGADRKTSLITNLTIWTLWRWQLCIQLDHVGSMDIVSAEKSCHKSLGKGDSHPSLHHWSSHHHGDHPQPVIVQLRGCSAISECHSYLWLQLQFIVSNKLSELQLFKDRAEQESSCGSVKSCRRSAA